MMIYQIYANVMVMIFFSRPRDGDDDISNIRNCGGDDDVSNIRNYGGDDDVSNICNCGGDDDLSNICNSRGDDDIDGDRFVLGLSNISQVRILSERRSKGYKINTKFDCQEKSKHCHKHNKPNHQSII